MLVKELIEKLQDMDPNALVVCNCPYYGDDENLSEVEETTFESYEDGDRDPYRQERINKTIIDKYEDKGIVYIIHKAVRIK